MSGILNVMLADNAAASSGWTGVTTGLTHHWTMADANVSGTTISDIVGTNHGTASGAGVTSAIGPSGAGTARQFDGTSTIALGSNALLNALTGDLTLCQWIYMPDRTATAGGSAPFFFQFSDGSHGIGLDYDRVDGNSIEFVTSHGGFDVGTAVDPVVNSTWLFAAAVRVGSGTPVLYINGSSVSLAGGVAQSPTATDNFIGSRQATGRRVPSGCRIGRTLIYDGTALSAGQIATNFAAQ